MNRIVNILNQSKPFFFATMDGKFPKVRPYNAVVEFDDKIVFADISHKNHLTAILAFRSAICRANLLCG